MSATGTAPAPPEAWTDDIATPGLLRRMAALLDRDWRTYARSAVIPRGWHVGLFPAALPQSDLRPDGYAGPGLALPDLGLPRVMLGGRRAAYAGDIPLGATVRRHTTIERVAERTGRSGRIAVVTVCSTLAVDGETVVTEHEDYVLREAATTASDAAAPAPAQAPPQTLPARIARTLTPDETLLFRFCAVTYNAHRIHYDAPYATGREGYPALVVNGPLTALLALELAREAAGREPAAFGYRLMHPLFCGRPMHLKAREEVGEELGEELAHGGSGPRTRPDGSPSRPPSDERTGLLSRRPAARRHPGRRPHERGGRSGLHPAAGRFRRGGDQGRAARRRRAALTRRSVAGRTPCRLLPHLNRGKQALGLDLKTPAARAVLERLVASSDVVVANMRPEALARLGLDADSLRDRYPRLVHCTITGFGPGGPYRGRPAYDSVVQGVSGIAGLAERRDGRPLYVPLLLADHVTGEIAASAILAALVARERTGLGATLEVPMHETMAAFVLQEHLGPRSFDPPLGPAGDARVLNPDNRPLATADGWISLTANTDAQVHAFLRAVGRPELIDDPRLRTVADRFRHVDLWFRVRAEALASRTSADWLAVFAAADVPAMPCHTLETLERDPHLAAVGSSARMSTRPRAGSAPSGRRSCRTARRPPSDARPHRPASIPGPCCATSASARPSATR